jgi:hypothetical protein
MRIAITGLLHQASEERHVARNGLVAGVALE